MAASSAIRLTPRAGIRFFPSSDARLVRLAAAGDERAFAAIYDRYHQELYRYCRAILGNGDEAQDALQSTMASALRSLPGESRRIELRPWLYRVAHNEAVSILRRRQPTVDADEVYLPREPAVDAAFESRERLRTLVADLATLPERQRSALVMREWSGLSHAEIAGALGTSEGAARQALYEARLALQELEEGRAMDCDPVRRALSDRDGRVLRGRKLRAHLRSCPRCRAFQAAIDSRAADLELLAPPLTAVAASGLLAGILGGGSGAGGVAAAGIGGGVTTAKVLGVVAASAALGVGAGAVGGLDLPRGGSDAEPAPRERTPPTASEPAAPNQGAEARTIAPEAPGPGSREHRGGNEGAGERGGKDHRGPGPASPVADPASQAAPGSAAGGASASAPAGTGQPATPPGSEVATDRSGGHSTTPTTGPPAEAGQGPPEHANAGGVWAEHGKPEE
jgi:RNA polymerase sigma factor (sigma-70 family)